MKKLIAAAFAVLLALMPAIPAAAVHNDEYDTTKVWMNKGVFVMCFDRFSLEMPDGTVKTQTDLFGARDGSAQLVLNENQIYLTNETAVFCYGWTGIKEGGAVTEKYGYKINEGAPVFDDNFKKGAEQAVYKSGGDSRFLVRIPVENEGKPILLTVVSKGSDGVVRDVLEFSVNGEYVSANSRHVSPAARIFKEAEKQKLNVVISGGTEYAPVVSGNEFTVRIRFVNNISASKAELYINYDVGLTFIGADFPYVSHNGETSFENDPASRMLHLKWIGAEDADGDFTFANLVFKAGGEIKKGFLHISADPDDSCVLNGSKQLEFNVINGGADIIPCLPGDVNGDGKTGNKDVTLLFRRVSDPDIKANEAADCNGDGAVDNKDVTKLFRIVCGEEKADLSSLLAPDVYGETTGSVNNIKSWTFNDGTAGNVIGVYCETVEPDAEVLICSEAGTVLLREKALYGRFFGRMILPENKASQKVYLYAKADGKALSRSSRAYTLEYGDSVGNGAIIGKDSHVFLNHYKDQYLGDRALSEAQAAGRMNYVKNKLYEKLGQVRARTGKNTKIVILVCTNPATVYHDLQYGEAEKGWGDVYAPSSVTQFGEFMKDDENIYMIDMRQILSEHKDRLLFMQADSHWTQIGSYYGYYLAAQRIKNDFPATKVYDLDADFDTHIGPGGGDLLGFMGAYAAGARAVSASVTPKSENMKAPSFAPTAYVMGDSYYGAFSPYLELLFSRVYLNEFETQAHPPLYDYTLDDLESKKPDYLFYIWTERNVDASLSWLEATVKNEGK